MRWKRSGREFENLNKTFIHFEISEQQDRAKRKVSASFFNDPIQTSLPASRMLELFLQEKIGISEIETLNEHMILMIILLESCILRIFFLMLAPSSIGRRQAIFPAFPVISGLAGLGFFLFPSKESTLIPGGSFSLLRVYLSRGQKKTNIFHFSFP